MQAVLRTFTLTVAATAILPFTNENAMAGKAPGDSFRMTINAWENYFGDVTIWFDARGAIDDYGPVTTYLAHDDLGEPIGWVWVLQGQQGTIEILDAGSQLVSAREFGKSCYGLRSYRRKSEGEFIVFDGDGAYTGAAGGGTYVEEYEVRVEYEFQSCVITAQQVTKLTGSLLP